MKRYLLVCALLSTACAGGGGAGGGGEISSSAPSCTSPLAVFSPAQKVQLAEAVELPLTALTVSNLGQRVLESDDEQGQGRMVKAGTRLTVVLKNTCVEPGEIARNVNRDPEAEGLAGVRSYPFELQSDMSQAELEALANTDSCVEGLSDSTISYADAISDDPMVKDQDHFENLSAEKAYPDFYDAALGQRESVVIAIVDTGVDIGHEDIKDALWSNKSEVPGNRVDDDHNGYVDDVNGYNFADRKASPMQQGSWKGNYHGTHVAGLAAARGYNKVGVSGVMSAGAKIMALNVFGNDPGAFSYHTENAIRYAADNGADVINLSIGGNSASASYKAALTYAVSKGVTVLAAAGNDGRQLGSSYFKTPGAYGKSINGMLTVGSIDAVDSAWSSFSNYSSTYVELGAPGSEDTSAGRGLLATVPGNAYRRLQGTSMATPVAAGAAGLAIQLMRALGYAATPARIELALEHSGRTVSKLTSKIKDGRVLDLKRLADYIKATYPQRTAPEPIVSQGSAGAVSTSGAIVPCS